MAAELLTELTGDDDRDADNILAMVRPDAGGAKPDAGKPAPVKDAKPNDTKPNGAAAAAAEGDEIDDTSLDSLDDDGDAGLAETPATGGDDGRSDQAQPVIAPPDSWPADKRAVFTTLPPDVQQFIAGRASEEKATVSRHITEASEKSKAADQERQQLAAARGTFIELTQKFDPIIAEGATLDWDKLARDDQPTYIEKRQAYESRVKQLNAAVAEQEKFTVEQRQAHLDREQEALLGAVPEWKTDTAKAAAEIQGLREFVCQHYGYKPEQVATIYDHRMLLLARDAAAGRKLREAAAAARAKKVPLAAPKQPRARASDDGAKGGSERAALLQRAGATQNDHEQADLIARALQR